MKRAFVAFVVCAGCHATRTEMVVSVVAGDEQVLGQIDHIALAVRDVDAGRDEAQVAATALCSATPSSGCVDLPAEIVLYPGPKNPGDTVEIELTGLSGNATRIDTAARFHFVTGQSGALTLALNSACLDLSPACAADPDAPYCEADGSCGQLPGGNELDLSTAGDLSTGDLGMADLSTPPDLTTCAAPSGNQAFVDNVHGTDDTMHGSVGGPCAWKTVTWALAHTSSGAVLNLADGETFGSGETFPLTVMGQTISCGNNVTLSGSGPNASSAQYTVELSSAGSTVHGCTITPAQPDVGCATTPPVGYTAVHVTGNGTPTNPIVIDHCVAVNSQLEIGVFVDDSKSGITISNNTLQATNSVQVSSSELVKILDNHLNAGCGTTTFSVRCGAGNSVSILGNDRGGGALSCNGGCYDTGTPPSGQQCP